MELLIFILVVGFGAVITRLAYLQLVKGEELRSKAVDQQLADTTLDAKRGTIYDKNMKILAQSASVWQVILAPIYFDNDEQREYVAKELSQILEIDEKELLEDTKQQSYYVNLQKKVDADVKDKIVELQASWQERAAYFSI